MGDPKIGDYKSSTILRALIWYSIGFLSCRGLQPIPIAIFAFGLYASKSKDPTQLKVFAALIFFTGIGKSLFNIGISISNREAQAPGGGPGGSTGGAAAGGIDSIFSSIGGALGSVQILIQIFMIYLCYSMWSK